MTPLSWPIDCRPILGWKRVDTDEFRFSKKPGRNISCSGAYAILILLSNGLKRLFWVRSSLILSLLRWVSYVYRAPHFLIHLILVIVVELLVIVLIILAPTNTALLFLLVTIL